MLKLFVSVFTLCLLTSYTQPGKKIELTSEEQKLYDLINEYRKSKKLPAIPLSPSLTYIAQLHCRDLTENKPDLKPGCNAHSWSDKGKWSSCCYTPDHKQATCMWNKPKELTGYKDYGFEIACGSSDPLYSNFVMTAEYALSAWKRSYHHNNVIINKDIWAKRTWNAIGIGIHKGFSTVWFGQSRDTTTQMPGK